MSNTLVSDPNVVSVHRPQQDVPLRGAPWASGTPLLPWQGRTLSIALSFTTDELWLLR